MKKHIIVIILFVLVTRLNGGEIPNDFLNSDNPHWKAYFKTYLVFPESRLTLASFVDCLKIPHVSTRGNDYDPTDIMSKLISLSATKLHPRQALWELKQQTGYDIVTGDRDDGTLLINFPKKVTPH